MRNNRTLGLLATTEQAGDLAETPDSSEDDEDGPADGVEQRQGVADAGSGSSDVGGGHRGEGLSHESEGQHECGNQHFHSFEHFPLLGGGHYNPALFKLPCRKKAFDPAKAPS